MARRALVTGLLAAAVTAAPTATALATDAPGGTNAGGSTTPTTAPPSSAAPTSPPTSAAGTTAPAPPDTPATTAPGTTAPTGAAPGTTGAPSTASTTASTIAPTGSTSTSPSTTIPTSPPTSTGATTSTTTTVPSRAAGGSSTSTTTTSPRRTAPSAPPFAADPSALTGDPLARVDPDAAVAPGKGGLWPVRPIVFPVLGPVTYDDGWGDARNDVPQGFHVGVDIIAAKLQPQVAAASGTLRITVDHPTAGWGVTIVGDDGWEYRYYHLNNDTPGTNDGKAPAQWRLAPGLTDGSRVQAGQLLAFTGNSGDAEQSVAHLHFEIRRPGDQKAINPFPSVRAAEFRTRCAPPALLGQLPGIPPPLDTDADVVDVAALDGVGSFRLSSNGSVFLVGSAREIGSAAHRAEDGACPSLPPPTPGTQVPGPPPATTAPATTTPTTAAPVTTSTTAPKPTTTVAPSTTTTTSATTATSTTAATTAASTTTAGPTTAGPTTTLPTPRP